MIHRIAVLARVEPHWYHCCVNTCMAYTGDDADSTSCRFCPEPRYTAGGKPRRLYCYLPLIPRLQGYFQNPKMVEKLLYRHNYRHQKGTVADVFDGVHYRTLRKKNVVVDGEELPHKYFSGRYDIALGSCTDSFLLFKRNRGGPSATPILLQNYTIPPDIRTHFAHLIPMGTIPGPKGPKDARSFLIPYDDELAELARGVPTFDSLTQTMFPLRAYNLFEIGDIIAIEKVLNITGHNGFCPCRTCEIRGVRNKTHGDTIYYVPLCEPDVHGQPIRTWNPHDLPLRTLESFANVAGKIEACTTETARKNVAKHYGIKGLPALRRVGSTLYGRSAPWEFMHLAFENTAPNMYKHWSGTFKGLDAGVEDYELSAAVWEEVWQESADATRHLPADFVRVLGNNPSYYTAEAWAFWIMYMAPALLKGRLKKKYYLHACQLASIIKRCIAFKLTYSDIDVLENDIIDWVEKYEE
jgi:hypothetical protein